MRTESGMLAVLRLFLRAGGRRLWLGALLAALTVLAGMALLGIAGWFITATALAGLSAAAAAALNIFLPSASIRLLALGRTFGRYAERVVTHDATLRVLTVLRERLFLGWAAPDAARRLLVRPARVLFRLTQDVDALESVYLRVAVPAAAALAASALLAVLLGALDVRLGMSALAWLLACGAGVVLVVARRARRLALARARGLERLRGQTIDLVSGQTDLLMAGRLAAQCAGVQRLDARLAQADAALHRLDQRAGWCLAMAGHVTVAGVLLSVAALMGQGHVGLPMAVLALLAALSAFEPFGALRRGALEAGRSWLAARRLGPQLVARASPAALREPPAGLAVLAQQLGARYAGSARAAVAGLDLRIGVGEHVALVGPSGAGKSTLLQLLAGERRADAGTLQARPATWMTQRTELFADSLRNNLLLANPAASDDQLWQALQASGLAQDVKRLPQGLDTLLGEGGLGLSGGQARRLALARLVLHPSDFWLLDEPTEGLDEATAQDVLQRLTLAARGRTLLVATHLRREAQLAGRLLVLQRGQLVQDVSHGDARFAAVLGALRQGGASPTPILQRKD